MAVILAAGGGTRMKSALPKVLHPIAHKPMLSHVLDSVSPLAPQKTVLVLAPNMEPVKKQAALTQPSCQFAIQEKPLGTGHAVKSALPHIQGFSGLVLVLYGDTPLIKTATIENLLAQHAQHGAAISLLGMQPNPPTGYGRLVMPEAPYVSHIVECKDATPEEKTIPHVWAGVIAFDAAFLAEGLAQLQPSPVTQEYYLTALIGQATARGLKTLMVPVDVEEAMGVNTRVQLAEADAALQRRLREAAMLNGATLISPETIYLATDTKLGRDVTIHPHVVFAPGVSVADNVEIRSFSHLEGARIENAAIIGPYARLRPGSVVGQGAHVGNFVELKKATLGEGAKANHLSYIGDATIGAHANVGAGTITCNYDGVNKFETHIGQGAFIGSNSALVAPVTIGAGALVGAGSVITQDVPEGATAIARGVQVIKPGKGAKKKA